MVIGVLLAFSKSFEYFTDFEIDGWNKTQNCYSYALNDKENRPWKEQQPGFISGIDKYSKINKDDYKCPTIIQRIKADVPNSILTTCTNQCPVGMRKIAVAVDPGKDYHFYRKDQNLSDGESTWSHKRGKLTPEQLENGQEPWTIKRQHGNSDYYYKNFCGCLCVN